MISALVSLHQAFPSNLPLPTHPQPPLHTYTHCPGTMRPVLSLGHQWPRPMASVCWGNFRAVQQATWNCRNRSLHHPFPSRSPVWWILTWTGSPLPWRLLPGMLSVRPNPVELVTRRAGGNGDANPGEELCVSGAWWGVGGSFLSGTVISLGSVLTETRVRLSSFPTPERIAEDPQEMSSWVKKQETQGARWLQTKQTD